MPQFAYHGIGLDGKRIKGKLNAPGEKQLAALLRQQGVLLLDAEELAQGKNLTYRLKDKELVEFCQRIGTMLGAGVPMIRVMNMMMDQCPKSQQKNIYMNLIGLLQQGVALSDAMEMQGASFPKILINMFRLGEMSGSLSTNALRMKDHFAKEAKQKGKIRTAAIYPAFLLVLMVAVMIAIFVGILPQFFGLFEGMPLPPVTQFMLRTSRFLVDRFPVVLAGLAVAAAVIILILRQPLVQRGRDKVKVRMPYLGKLNKIVYTSRFARTLSTLYASGVPMLQSLQVIQSIIGNQYVASQFGGMQEGVQNGDPLSVVVARVDGFDQKLPVTILAGEESGQLEKMLSYMADAYDEEADQAIARMMAMLEPAMIIILAIMIGTIAVSVIVPLTQVYNYIG